MTSAGLKWWHAVCREVRESGTRSRNCDPTLAMAILCHDLRNSRHLGKQFKYFPIPVQPKALAFLRTQWLAAYRKAWRG
jgi:hypothetical protein